MKHPKYLYRHVVQSSAGYGWADIDQSETRELALLDLEDYQAKAPGQPYRVIRRRVLNEMSA